MTTISVLKGGSSKKSVPIKWRDLTWHPRIIIRSVSPREAAVSFWECQKPFFQTFQVQKPFSIGRVGSGTTRARRGRFCATLPLVRSRLFPSTSSDQPI